MVVDWAEARIQQGLTANMVGLGVLTFTGLVVASVAGWPGLKRFLNSKPVEQVAGTKLVPEEGEDGGDEDKDNKQEETMRKAEEALAEAKRAAEAASKAAQDVHDVLRLVQTMSDRSVESELKLTEVRAATQHIERVVDHASVGESSSAALVATAGLAALVGALAPSFLVLLGAGRPHSLSSSSS